jgi:hypothetical protein
VGVDMVVFTSCILGGSEAGDEDDGRGKAVEEMCEQTTSCD